MSFQKTANINRLEETQFEDDYDEFESEDALKRFRNSWKSELKSKHTSASNYTTCLPNNVSGEMEAKYWFEKGICFERVGKLYDAVACYRRATQLVPDIEFKYYYNFQQQQQQQQQQEIHVESPARVDHNNAKRYDTFPCDNEVDLLTKFEMLNVDEEGNFCLCKPETICNQFHISQLPVEVLLYVCKWVVTNDLDFRSLEQLAKVCRGFYVLSRDAEIWKLGCLKVWAANKADSLKIADYGGSWRKMFIEKPRVNFNGAYISRTTYVRQGENSFQDVDYKPCYLVEYYRYLRFFPDGTVLMLNTPDNPYQSLSKLRYRKCKQPVLSGQYRLSGSSVTAVLKRTQRAIDAANSHYKRSHLKSVQISEQEFRVLLEIKTIKGRRNFQLFWKSYSVVQRRNGQESLTAFDISHNKFPPFSFSRVKSYTTDALKPLM